MEKKKEKYSLMEEGLLWCTCKSGKASVSRHGVVGLPYALAARILMEFIYRGIVEHKKKGSTYVFAIKKDEKTGDDILDEAIEIMKDNKEPTINEWVKCTNGTLLFEKGIKDMKIRIWRRLAEKNVLREVKM